MNIFQSTSYVTKSNISSSLLHFYQHTNYLKARKHSKHLPKYYLGEEISSSPCTLDALKIIMAELYRFFSLATNGLNHFLLLHY